LIRHGWRIVRFTYEMDDQTIIDEVLALFPGRK
jgi:hypothetical protein